AASWRIIRGVNLLIMRKELPMNFPSIDELRRISEAYGFSLGREELEVFKSVGDGILTSYARLDQMHCPRFPVKYPRDPGTYPDPQENVLDAWAWRWSVKGAASGKLEGSRHGVQDQNLCCGGAAR